MNSNRVRAVLVAVTAVASVLGAPDQATAEPAARGGTQWKCGFYPTPGDPQGTTARYFHCAYNHIMIRVHWSNGASHLGCIEPWENHPFWRDGGNVVVNAYFVPVTPRVLIAPSGRRVCAASQPTG
ncbi:DUF6355 family natural product biosynthesis protein [Actinokineospora sp. HUAS TT18]|uniref:DUF6355 family natural product biosynthesis protein n=1 Tax=Actinokineospora sp. HUAS TT18 TaxID=3447451 RepID=UPI003F524031